MRILRWMLPVAIFATSLCGGFAIAASKADAAKESAANCITLSQLKKNFRKDEAVRIVTDLNSRVMNALDKVLLSNGVGDPNFENNINFVLGLQKDVNNMDITIETFHITNGTDFRNAWASLNSFYKYRKRNITNYILVDYKDDDCLREVTVYGVGQSFGILKYLPGNQPPGAPPGPPWHTTLDFVDFDRFVITWVEVATGVFRVKSLVQFTESTFPLPNGANVPTGHSPFDPNAPANYEPTAP